MWDFNDGFMSQPKDMKLKWIQVMKYSTPGLNNDIGIIINSAGKR